MTKELTLYNSFTNSLTPFRAISHPIVKMYNCGPTVYDYAHIGNFRTFLMADLLRRVLEQNGYEVQQVMNITDVGHMTNDDFPEGGGEDKMTLAVNQLKSKKAGRKEGYKDLDFKSPWDVADFYIKAFKEDFNALNLKKPMSFPRATEHIDTMVKMIKALIDKGYAYKASDGAYYFDISSFKEYGRLSNNTMESLKTGAGGRIDEIKSAIKRNPYDFALWKKDDTHIMKWETELGVGFPGWHIECSAMIKELLGDTIDIHTGGEDNKFPHHECEIAQSMCANGAPFVNYWIHAKFLLVDGEKMSKSKGNFYTIRDLINMGHHPLAIRWALMTTHYAQTMNFTLTSLGQAKSNINRLVELRDKLLAYEKGSIHEDVEVNISKICCEAQTGFVDSLNDNLNISGSLAYVFNFVTKINSVGMLSKEQAKTCLQVLKVFDSILGVIFDYGVEEVDANFIRKIENLISERNEARKTKNFKQADRIRNMLRDLGIEIRDTSQKTEWKKI
ncbi:MAG: cysteine--tRNA ligase [Pseudomonadota bacterium]